jgi:hypothetical protein
MKPELVNYANKYWANTVQSQIDILSDVASKIGPVVARGEPVT